MSLILPANEDARRELDRAETEELLLSMLARQEPPKRFQTETEMGMWFSQRIALAEAILRLTLQMGPQAVSAVPLGSVVPMKLRRRTKSRGPKIEIEISDELEIRLREEEPAERDLLLLVDVDNQALRQGRSPIVAP